MSDDTYKSREKIRNWAVAVVAAASLALGIFNFVDNRLARRDAERPYLGMDNVTVDQDSIGISAGGTIPKGRLFVQPGAIHATFRVYGTSLAIIRSYKMDCSSWPFTGGEDSRPNLTLPPGATKVFTCAPNITTPDQYAQLEDPTETRRIELTKAINFKLNIVYEDMFHRIETKDFCFSNAPDWDHTHLRSCEEEPAKTK